MAQAPDLLARHCKPCEGSTPALGREQAEALRTQVPEWKLSDDGRSIRRTWRARHFTAALAFLERVGEVAEAEGHHPDLHLTGYRHVAIELTTHAVGGLSENDFILAARIDALPGPDAPQ